MKRQRPIAIGIIFALVLSLLAPLSESLSRVLNADIITANAMSTDEYGTESNPYRILQIVPDSSMGTMKYLLSGFDKYTKNSSATYGLSDITTLGELISDGEDTILRYEETGKEFKLDPTSSELATGDWEADNSIEFNHVNGYYQYTTTGDYKLDSATDGYVYSGPGAQYLPNVMYYTDDTSVGNLDFNVIFSYDDGTSSGEKYVVKEEVSKEGGDYKKANFYMQDNNGDTCPRFMLVTGATTKQRYSVDTVTKNESGFYIEDEGRYTFNDTQMNDSKESRCDVTFKADDTGDYYIANMWAPREEDGPLYRYTMPDYYIFDKGNGDYDVTFTHLEGSTSEYTYTATASISEENGNYAAVLDSATPYREAVPGETGYYKFSYLYRFSYDKGNGQYSFTEANIVDATELPQPLPETLVDPEQKFWLTNQTIYREGYVKKSFKIVNNDLLKRYFIGLDSKEQRDNYYIEITTFTPTDLNSNVASAASSGTLNALQTANLIYITDYFDSKLTKLAEITPSNANYSESNDISADVALKLVECVTGKDTKSRNPGLILDYKESAYSNANSSTKVNMYKFIAAGAIYGISGFYNFFLNDYNGTATPAMSFNDTFTKVKLIPHAGSMKGLLGVRNVDLVPGSGVNKYEYTRSVIENVYFNVSKGYSESLLTNLNNEIYTSTNHSTYAKAFEDAKEVIDNDSVGRFAIDKRLTPAAMMYYVANYRTDYNAPVDKESLKVLDIEPCNDFTTAKSSFSLNGEFSDNSTVGDLSVKLTESTINNETCTNIMKVYFRSVLSDFYGPIEIEEQTSAEFIGEIGDLNTMYDVIYFGLNTGKMNLTSTHNSNDTLNYGWTQYNDNRLDGLIYMHVGDRVIGTLKYGGIKETRLVNVGGKNVPTEMEDSSVYSGQRTVSGSVSDLFSSTNISTVTSLRYSGNDLTKVMVKKLKEFVDAGYCILAENALYDCNKKYIDDSSNIYNFFADVRSKDNVIDVSSAADNATMKKLEKAIGYEKIKIHLSEKPANNVTDTGITQYNNQLVDGKKTIKFTFKIEDDNVSDIATYTAQIYIDSDADGFYETKADGSNEVVRTRTNLKKNTEYTM
ncbi:MAG: DUF5057 domain-containing protein, partial [Lachnospiraceae bacterium]|nr:DUF5057 domain-containing protein [Lachnospiraceae bacterium]